MNCTFLDNNRIDIGNDVLIAPDVKIYTATHSTDIKERMVSNWVPGQEICRTYALPMKIEDGVWIGGGTIILPGVTIGRKLSAQAVLSLVPFPPTASQSAIRAESLSN